MHTLTIGQPVIITSIDKPNSKSIAVIIKILQDGCNINTHVEIKYLHKELELLNKYHKHIYHITHVTPLSIFGIQLVIKKNKYWCKTTKHPNNQLWQEKYPLHHEHSPTIAELIDQKYI